jgi:signal transduction histidine kinase
MPTFATSAARISSNVFARYLVATLVAILALTARWVLAPALGDDLPLVTLFPAVAFAAWCCGVGPSLVLTGIGILGGRYLFVVPKYSLAIPGLPQSVGLLTFAAGAIVIIAIGEYVRRDLTAMYESRSELEDMVRKRTAELDSANQNLGELTARLLHLQDEERRRIARELHDSVGQTLAALSMNLATVGTELERLAKTATVVADSSALVTDMSTDIRTISYLLHPPLLDEAGLSSALTWYIKGFSERSKIDVALDIPEDFGRLPRDRETAVFRVVQECLTNIHRHSGSAVAKIKITRDVGNIQVRVSDRGKGIPAQKRNEISSSATATPGVGIRGMRERLRQLGGTLDIYSDGEGKGAVITAKLPIPRPAEEKPTPAQSAAASA